MKNYRKIIILIVSLFVSANLFAGTTTGAFAIKDFGARSIALGGAFVSIADDANAAPYNAAALGFIENKYFTGTYANLNGLKLMDDFYLSYVQPDEGLGAAGLYWHNLVVNSIYKNEDGDKWNPWSEHVVGYSYAKRVLKYWSLGGTIKGFYADTNIKPSDMTEKSSGSGLGLDLSTMVKYKNYKLGLNFRDVYSFVKYQKKKKDILPFSYDLGVSGLFANKYLFAVEFMGGKEEALQKVSLGAEANFFKDNMLSLRAGLSNYLGDKGKTTFSAGLGFNYKNFIIDYTYLMDEDALGSTNYFGFTMKF